MVGRVPPSVLPRSSQLRRFRIFRVSAHRVLSSARVTPEKTLRSPSQRPATAAVGRRIVAAQDGGQLPRPAAARAWLGLVDAEIWTCEAAPGLPCRNRAVADKESHRWLRTAGRGCGRISGGDDRGGDGPQGDGHAACPAQTDSSHRAPARVQEGR